MSTSLLFEQMQEAETILAYTESEYRLHKFLKNKCDIDIASASITSKNQTVRCVAFFRDNENHPVLDFFIDNPKYKPCGLTTMVELARLYDEEWQQHQTEILEILHYCMTTPTVKRFELLWSGASPLDFLESQFYLRLGKSLIGSRSKFHNGSENKYREVYDKLAEAGDYAL